MGTIGKALLNTWICTIRAVLQANYCAKQCLDQSHRKSPSEPLALLLLAYVGGQLLGWPHEGLCCMFSSTVEPGKAPKSCE